MKTETKGGIIKRFTKVSDQQIDFDITTFKGEEMRFSLSSNDPNFINCICSDNKVTINYNPVKIENSDRFDVVNIDKILFWVTK